MSEQAQPQSFVRKCFAKAEELFQALLPTSELFRGSAARDWVFRGHGDSKWRLVPTARRRKAEGLVWGEEPPTNWDQLHKEIAEVARFFDVADRRGHVLPEDSQELRQLLLYLTPPPAAPRAEYIQRLKDWPTYQVLSLVGLAQHHGMQTSLLDWTWNPLCAAYFAASSAARKLASKGPGGGLSVWALSTLTFEWSPFGESALIKGASKAGGTVRLLDLVTVPSATNANLHAQEGLFVHVRQFNPAVDLQGPVDRDGLEILIASEPFNLAGRTLLYQLTLPVAESPRLLQLVGQLGASAGRFNPTLRGVVEELEETGLVDRQGRKGS